MSDSTAKFLPGDRVRTNSGQVGIIEKVEKRQYVYSYLVNGIGSSAKWITEGALRIDAAAKDQR